MSHATLSGVSAVTVATRQPAAVRILDASSVSPVAAAPGRSAVSRAGARSGGAGVRYAPNVWFLAPIMAKGS